MKKEFSTNNLLIIAFIAIGLSLFSLLLSLNKLEVTGAASTGAGYTNVTVIEATDISIVRAQINFTDANPGDTRDSHESDHVNQCTIDNECGINITNDGSVDINITLENTDDLFESATLDQSIHYLYNITLGDNSTDYTAVDCSTGGSRGLQFNGTNGDSGWRAFPPQGGSEVAICGLNSTDGHDSVQVDVNITIPGDEAAGIKSGTITFSAYKWN